RRARRDRRGRRRLLHEDRDLRQGRPESPGRDRPGARPRRPDDGGRDGEMTGGSDLPNVELSPAASRAVEAALGAGASAAEAYASRDGGREVRVHGGEVESLTAATQTGIGIRAWDGHRVGYAYGTDLSEAGVAALAARAAEIEALAGLDSPSVAAWSAGQVADIALTVERTALAADPRVAGVETAVYADSTEQVAIASSTGIAAAYETANCFAYLQALAEGDGSRETGLGFGLARGPEDLDPEAIGAEGAERAVSMIGA